MEMKSECLRNNDDLHGEIRTQTVPPECLAKNTAPLCGVPKERTVRNLEMEILSDV